jgi:hypothetical protein
MRSMADVNLATSRAGNLRDANQATRTGVQSSVLRVAFRSAGKAGLRQTPAKIVKQLRSSLGFTKIRWLDASQISAHES